MLTVLTSVGVVISPYAAQEMTQAAYQDEVAAHRALAEESNARASRVVDPPEPLRMNSWAREFFRGYPRAALNRGQEGSVTVLAEIDIEGRVTECTVTQSSGHPILDTYSCDALKELGRFRPARNIQGEPIVGTWSETFHFEVN